ASTIDLVVALLLVFAVVEAVIGAIALTHGAPVGAGASFVGAAAWAVAALRLARASASFRDILKTEGSDVVNLISALSHLRRAFGWQALLLGLIVVVDVAVLVLIGIGAAVR